MLFIASQQYFLRTLIGCQSKTLLAFLHPNQKLMSTNRSVSLTLKSISISNWLSRPRCRIQKIIEKKHQNASKNAFFEPWGQCPPQNKSYNTCWSIKNIINALSERYRGKWDFPPCVSAIASSVNWSIEVKESSQFRKLFLSDAQGWHSSCRKASENSVLWSRISVESASGDMGRA